MVKKVLSVDRTTSAHVTMEQVCLLKGKSISGLGGVGTCWRVGREGGWLRRSGTKDRRQEYREMHYNLKEGKGHKKGI